VTSTLQNEAVLFYLYLAGLAHYTLGTKCNACQENMLLRLWDLPSEGVSLSADYKERINN